MHTGERNTRLCQHLDPDKAYHRFRSVSSVPRRVALGLRQQADPVVMADGPYGNPAVLGKLADGQEHRRLNPPRLLLLGDARTGVEGWEVCTNREILIRRPPGKLESFVRCALVAQFPSGAVSDGRYAMKVLVTTASRHGSTAEIAEVVGDVLGSRGFDVTVAPPEDVGALSGLEAVVLGSAVYMGHWLAPAIVLADRIGTELAGRPVWLFSSGPVGDPSSKFAKQMDVDPVDLPAVRKVTGAREHKRFSGKLDRHNLRGLQRAGLSLFRGLQGDFRDWNAIRQWAMSIADQLPHSTAA
jgi:menaquinone-dependent protoporphyrinogen oxidase